MELVEIIDINKDVKAQMCNNRRTFAKAQSYQTRMRIEKAVKDLQHTREMLGGNWHTIYVKITTNKRITRVTVEIGQ